MPALPPPDPERAIADLLAAYGPQGWWPSESDFETLGGAILTQNASWRNAELGIAGLRSRGLLSARAILSADEALLAEAIRSAGCAKAKAERLRALCSWLESLGALDSLDPLRSGRFSAEALREELLSVRGIGEETADCILLYALGIPRFVADAYARRIFFRLGWAGERSPYREVQLWAEERCPDDAAWMGEAHALLVALGKRHCRARPACDGCPLRPSCRTGR